MKLQRRIIVMMIYLLLMMVIGFIFGTINEHGDINAGGMYLLVFTPIAFIFGLINLILITVGLKLIQNKWKNIIAFLLSTIFLLIFKGMIMRSIGDNREEIYWIGLTMITIMNLIEFGIIYSKSIKME